MTRLTVTVGDVIAYLQRYVPDQQTIVVLHSEETAELDGAIAMEVVLDEIEEGAVI